MWICQCEINIYVHTRQQQVLTSNISIFIEKFDLFILGHQCIKKQWKISEYNHIIINNCSDQLLAEEDCMQYKYRAGKVYERIYKTGDKFQTRDG